MLQGQSFSTLVMSSQGQIQECFFFQGEATLQEIQAALHDIAQAQLEMQKIEASGWEEILDQTFVRIWLK